MTTAGRRRRLGYGWKSKLRKTDDFSSVFRLRRLCRGALVDILSAPNQLDYPRLGLVVPRKVIAAAVGRNRTRRVLREAFRLSQAELGGCDIIVRVKAPDPGPGYRREWAAFLRSTRLSGCPDAATNG